MVYVCCCVVDDGNLTVTVRWLSMVFWVCGRLDWALLVGPGRLAEVLVADGDGCA